ncbi:RHTO0S10e03400g1_1 [Rhodotorula toruloides]|uniref:RHTO0S10e03400g1_1 n=1 Tax=Rhodotorula toruloides TaxID=5286 RepID=A0A061B527_RHOTO|nr:RHTO0S10e03400g1_1 [Rhodotorula toruloides]
MQLWDCARPKERRGRFTRFISWMRRRTDKEKVTHEAVSRCDAVDVVPVSPNFPTPVNDGPATAAGKSSSHDSGVRPALLGSNCRRTASSR